MERTKANPNFQEKIEAKKERYTEIAERNRKKSESTYNRAKEMASVIPMGQPILVGHHSEKSDRRYRDRIHNTFGKSFELQDKAKYYEEKASSYGSGGIMSDDPEAIIKLKEKIEKLEERRDKQKEINKAIRKHLGNHKGIKLEKACPEVQAIRSALKTDLMKICNDKESLVEQLLTPSYTGHYGVPSWSTTNIGATIREAKRRLEYMMKEEKRPDFIREFNNGIEAREEDGRINIYFPDKPNEEIRKRLKSYPFSMKWSPTLGAWTRKKTDSMGSRFFTELEDFLEKI